MAVEIDLPGSDGGLFLEIGDGPSQGSEWCRCFAGRERRFLGGQPASYVVQHLLQILDDPRASPVGEIHGEPVSWVMSLSSPHTSVYSTVAGEEQRLLLQDSDGKVFASITLNAGQRAQWKTKLRSYLDDQGE